MHDLLNAREEKVHIIKSFIEANQVVITIKANIPGIDKNIKEAYLLCHLFSSVLIKHITYEKIIHQETSDGPIIFIILKAQDIHQLKKLCMDIEESHPLGRFIDLDCYNDVSSLSRNHLKLHLRTCYLCDKPAVVCAKEKNHIYEELINHIKSHVKSYIHELINQLIYDSMIEELSFDLKFGCVSTSSSGSHHDMDSQLMISTIPVIVPYLLEIFDLTFDDIDHPTLIKQARKIGQKAEKAMLEQTHGINTYKGLIFLLGFVMLSLGRIITSFSDKNLFDYMIELSKSIKDDFINPIDTQGMLAYKNHHILGVRGEVLSGLATLRSIIERYPYPLHLKRSDYLYIFVQLIIHLEDTVFLKRAKSFERYKDIKLEFKHLDISNMKQVNLLHQKMVDQNISFGGSADMLVLYILFYKINQKLIHII